MTDAAPSRPPLAQTIARSFTKPSVLALIGANLLPLAGLFFFDWDLLTVLLVYWVETAVIGLFNILKLLAIGGAKAIPLILFFIVHFGIFMCVHFAFIRFLTGDTPNAASSFLPDLQTALPSGVRWMIIPLAISHGVSFVVNFLRHEREKTELPVQMFKPYARVIVMHMTILIGAFVTQFFGSHNAIIALLIAMKIVVDLFAHAREHRETFETAP